MSEPTDEPETVDDELADEAADLILDAEEQLQENRKEQQEFLDTVAEEEGEAPVETTCNIVGDYTVPLSAKMNGDLIDRMSAVQEQGQRVEQNPESEGHKISEVADQMCQVLADVIDDPEWHKQKFYEAYRAEGPEPILTMLERCFDALKQERERMEGDADGFRSKSGGT